MNFRRLINQIKSWLVHRIDPTDETKLPATETGLPHHEQRYADGVLHLEEGDIELAMAAFLDFLSLTHQTALIDSEVSPYHISNSQEYTQFEKEFRSLLDKKFYDWEVNKLPLPRFLKSMQNSPTELVSPKGKKILFLIPEYIMNSKRFIEADFKDHLLDTAVNAGAEVDFFPTDRCSYPGASFDAILAKTELDLLSARVALFKPDVILIDGNYVPSAESLNPAWMEPLKVKHKFRVIVFIGDAWGSHWVPAADSWSEIADIVYHFAPETPIEKEGKFPEKLYWDGYPVNERNFFSDSEKNLDISFVGTYVSALRAFWLTVALKITNDLKLKHRLLPHKREAGVALTMEAYATVMRQSRTVLNFSTRIGPIKMMTGRTWQAISSGVVLLDESNQFTSAYFVPFVHFIPFSTSYELAYAIRFFAGNYEYARRIGEASNAFCRQYYSSTDIWSRLLGATYSRASKD